MKSRNDISHEVDVGHEVISDSGEVVGPVEELFVPETQERPAWARVRLRTEKRSAFVPLTGAVAKAGKVHIAFGKQEVIAASHMDPVEHPEIRATLNRHYGIAHYGIAGPPAGPPDDFP